MAHECGYEEHGGTRTIITEHAKLIRQIRGSTMGSRTEFSAMLAFVRAKKIRPVVSRVVRGLDNLEAIDSLFEDMKHGRQFGKLVIELVDEDEARCSRL